MQRWLWKRKLFQQNCYISEPHDNSILCNFFPCYHKYFCNHLSKTEMPQRELRSSVICATIPYPSKTKKTYSSLICPCPYSTPSGTRRIQQRRQKRMTHFTLRPISPPRSFVIIANYATTFWRYQIIRWSLFMKRGYRESVTARAPPPDTWPEIFFPATLVMNCQHILATCTHADSRITAKVNFKKNC